MPALDSNSTSIVTEAWEITDIVEVTVPASTVDLQVRIEIKRDLLATSDQYVVDYYQEGEAEFKLDNGNTSRETTWVSADYPRVSESTSEEALNAAIRWIEQTSRR